MNSVMDSVCWLENKQAASKKPGHPIWTHALVLCRAPREQEREKEDKKAVAESMICRNPFGENP